MVNSFSFSKREVLEAIMEEKKLSDSFMVLSLHFIKQCSDKWKSDYWDRRDMASVNMCQEIVLCPEFARFYESRCGKESGIWELCTSGGVYHKDMLLGVKLIHGGARYYLMESDLFGEDMYHIIVNDYGRCVMTSEDGFNPLYEEMDSKVAQHQSI